MEKDNNLAGIIVAVLAFGIFLFRIYQRMQKAKQNPAPDQKTVSEDYEPYKDGPAEEASDTADSGEADD